MSTDPRGTLTAAELNQFTGTEHWHRHTLNTKITFTDGVQFLAERAGAYWLIDEIACANLRLPGMPRLLGTEILEIALWGTPKATIPDAVKTLEGQKFQVWKLRLDDPGDGATLSVEDGNGNMLHSKRIEFTDFPLREIDIWCIEGGPQDTRVILLPSEY